MSLTLGIPPETLATDGDQEQDFEISPTQLRVGGVLQTNAANFLPDSELAGLLQTRTFGSRGIVAGLVRRLLGTNKK